MTKPITSVLLLIGSGVALTACSQGPVDPFSADADTCADIVAIATAYDESPIPFESLRHESRTFGDGNPIPGSWTTKASINGAPCTLGEMDAFGNSTDKIQILRCHFSEDASDVEKGRADFEAARDYVETCLPDEFVAKDSPDVIEPGTSIVYEREKDRELQEDADFYVYPVQLQYAKEKRNNFGPPRAKASVNIAFQATHKAPEPAN